MFDAMDFGQSALQAVFQLSLHASAVVFVILLIQFIFDNKISARWRYAMWGIVVARLLIPWNYEAPVLRGVLDSPEVVPVALEQTFAISQTENSNPVTTTISQPSDVRAPQAESVAMPTPTNVADAHRFNPWAIASVIWWMGVVGIPCFILASHRRLTRRIQGTYVDPPDWITDTLDDVRKEFGITARPQVLVTSQIHAPTLIGVIYPTILLPVKLVEESSRQDMRLFFLHELTHLRTGDIWLSWLWCIAVSVHWFNPLMWWTGTRIRKDRELACDETVMRHIGANAKSDYAGALLRVASEVSGMHRPRYRFGLVGIAENKSEMTHRIERILKPIVHNKRLRFVSAAILMAIFCTSFVQLVPAPQIASAQESQPGQNQRNEKIKHTAFIEAVDAQMKMIEARITRGDAYRDKSDLYNVYNDLTQQNPTPSKSDMKEMIHDLTVYADSHSDDEAYGWRIRHLMSLLSRHTDEQVGAGEEPSSLQYLRESTALYPRTKYAMPSKHSKFQHLVNEVAMMIWDREGLAAAEKYVVHTWQNDRRFLYFFDGPWRQRMEQEGINLDRLEKLQQQLTDKPPLKEVKLILTPDGLHYEGKLLSSSPAIKQTLIEIENPHDHFIALGITSEDITLKKYRTATNEIMTLVADLGFDHFSDIGVQPSSTSTTISSSP